MIIDVEIEVENTVTEETAWVPAVVNLKYVTYARPSIDDDEKYSGTNLTFVDGKTITIKTDFKRIKEIIK